MAKVLALCLTLLGTALCTPPPTATTSAGVYQGNASISDLDQFLGIRYAEPPVGDLRFANPVPYQSECHVHNAQAYGPGCSQLRIYGQYNGLAEDCLTLNVIRPRGAPLNAALPVLFWIHGGGNANGQSIFYNGTALVQHSIQIEQPVIYVGINYRLAGFGFLNNPAFLAAGLTNLGLKDQYLALQWVHHNIAAFGGDPSKVMIFGESAGAADCWAQLHYAYLKNETNLYFRGTITESGAPGSPAFPIAEPAETGAESYKQLLVKVNCSDADDSIDCLRKVPHRILSPLLVNVAIANYALDHDWFSADLTDLVTTGQYAKLPIIHGSNFDEGSVFMGDPFKFPKRPALVDTVASVLNNKTELAQDIVHAYFKTPLHRLGKGYDADESAPAAYWRAVGVYTDLYMDLGKHIWLDLASQTQPAWGYSFRQQPPLSALNLSYEYPGYSKAFDKRVGVFHGAELPYVFGEATSLVDRTQGDVKVAIAVMDAWISFAYTLDPNQRNDQDVPNWPLYNSSDLGTLMVYEQQGGLSIRSKPWTERAPIYQLWGKAFRAIGEDTPL